jgi:hypothetical protein
MMPEVHQVISFSGLDQEKRPRVAFGDQAEEGEDLFIGCRPVIDVNAVDVGRVEGRKILYHKIAGVFPQDAQGTTPEKIIFLDPVGPSGAEDVQLGAVAVEVGEGIFPADAFFEQLGHSEDGKIGPDEFVEVEQGRIIQGIVHPARTRCRAYLWARPCPRCT